MPVIFPVVHLSTMDARRLNWPQSLPSNCPPVCDKARLCRHEGPEMLCNTFPRLPWGMFLSLYCRSSHTWIIKLQSSEQFFYGHSMGNCQGATLSCCVITSSVPLPSAIALIFGGTLLQSSEWDWRGVYSTLFLPGWVLVANASLQPVLSLACFGASLYNSLLPNWLAPSAFYYPHHTLFRLMCPSSSLLLCLALWLPFSLGCICPICSFPASCPNSQPQLLPAGAFPEEEPRMCQGLCWFFQASCWLAPHLQAPGPLSVRTANQWGLTCCPHCSCRPPPCLTLVSLRSQVCRWPCLCPGSCWSCQSRAEANLEFARL